MSKTKMVKKKKVRKKRGKRLVIGKKRKYLLIGVLGLTLALLIWIFWDIPLPNKLASVQIPVSTKLYDRKGKLIYEIYTDKRSTPIPLGGIPDYVKNATIAIEDKDFYKHSGFSISGMIRAFYKTIFRQKLEGGSTLTQQLVKTALLSPERTIRRKIREFSLALIVETIYSKDKILEMYLNQIPYGSTAYGVEAASNLYFGKSAKDVSLGEAAMLAGLTAAPSKYSPFGSRPDLVKERQKLVLQRMVEDGYITQEEANKAFKEEIKYAEVEAPKAAHFALWIKEQLSEKYGEAVTEQGGLRVTTTLDLELQDLAQEVVATEVAKLSKQNVKNGAALVIRPKTGEILAMVGSKDYFAKDEEGKLNIIFAKRQPGSSIKPLNYALALKDKKITLSTPLTDVPTCFSVQGQPLYCPKNYDGAFHGLIQARFALGSSYNIPAVKVLALNGIENFIEFARSMGITTFIDPANYGLSLTLGGGEVRPHDMAEAFGVFANGGIRQPLVSIIKIEDWKGKVLEETSLEDLEGDRVLSPEVSFLISHTLLDNNARSAAFGESSYLNVRGHPEVSVKTGTTNDLRDNWTIGYTEHALVVSWVGNNDNSPMRGAVSGISGASPIWNRIMKLVLDKAEEGFYGEGDEGHAWPKQPEGVTGNNVCWTTGSLAGESTDNTGCPVRFEYFLKDSLPPSQTETRLDIPVDKTLLEIARPDTPPENIEIQNHPVIYDPLGTIYCLDCALPTKPITIKYPL